MPKATTVARRVYIGESFLTPGHFIIIQCILLWSGPRLAMPYTPASNAGEFTYLTFGFFDQFAAPQPVTCDPRSTGL